SFPPVSSSQRRTNSAQFPDRRWMPPSRYLGLPSTVSSATFANATNVAMSISDSLAPRPHTSLPLPSYSPMSIRSKTSAALPSLNYKLDGSSKSCEPEPYSLSRRGSYSHAPLTTTASFSGIPPRNFSEFSRYFHVSAEYATPLPTASFGQFVPVRFSAEDCVPSARRHVSRPDQSPVASSPENEISSPLAWRDTYDSIRCHVCATTFVTVWLSA